MAGPIIVGSDGSDTSLEAVRRAADLACDLGAELHVAIVYESGHGHELAPLIARGGKSHEMLGAVGRYTSARGHEPAFHMLAGDAVDTICALASELSARIVVVGSRGMGGMKDSLKGSVPTRIARSATCDVYIARTT